MIGLAVMAGTIDNARAEAPELHMPIDCAYGQECWIPRYVDHDRTTDFRDYACGTLGSDGHKGTDFALRSISVMARGVAVLAAAEGYVTAVRDEMPDITVEQGGLEQVAGRECGNGVVVDHGGGWETQYCHMRRGSLHVRVGDKVERGQQIGLVGLSGSTSFPHLHLSVRHLGQIVDPFLGPEGTTDQCSLTATTMWAPNVLQGYNYTRSWLSNAGFAPGRPEADDTRRGFHNPTTMPASIPAIVFWVEGYSLKAGDRVRFTITDPDGNQLHQADQHLSKDWTRWFGFSGIRRKSLVWPEGTYIGAAMVIRDGQQMNDLTLRQSVTLTSPTVPSLASSGQ